VQLEHSFSVPVGIDEAWKILLDIERIGPCMPGARIDSVEGDEFTGTVKVKLGPINLTYKGKASFVQKDEVGHRAVIDARGRDARGNGTAAAVVTATLSEAEGMTTVRVDTDLEVTGKPAQFGRGVMTEVGAKLLGQFADALAATLRGPDVTTPAAPEAAAAPSAEAETAAPAEAETASPDAEAETASPDAEAETASPDAEQPAPARKPRPRPAHRAEVAPSSHDAPDEPIVPPAAEPGAADPASAETTPAYSVPGGIPAARPNAVSSVSSVNGRPPQADVEPIDLLHTAGPAVAKRLAPVAVAAVVVLLALRRRAHHRR
jgi:carbon monoxide dehydrogenase subunit G